MWKARRGNVVEGGFVSFLFSYHVLVGRESELLMNDLCVQETHKRAVEKTGREAIITLPG
jgi:hypothetical protein